jgi:hypothetical protein
MTLNDPKLRIPMALMLVSLLSGAAIFHFSLHARMTAEARLIAATTRADQTAGKVRDAPARLIQDQAEAALHSRIRDSGFIGPEDRVGWISALARSQSLFRLSSLSWHLSPQARSPVATNLNASKLEFTAAALDPAGLGRLITHLRATAPGRFTVEQCTLILDHDGGQGQANCVLNWWTLAHDAN